VVGRKAVRGRCLLSKLAARIKQKKEGVDLVGALMVDVRPCRSARFRNEMKEL